MPVNVSDEKLLRPADIDVASLCNGIVDWVEMETPTNRPDLIEKLLDHVETGFVGLPVDIRRIPAKDGYGGHMVLRYAPENTNLSPALLMGHVDTVWTAGTLERRPVRRQGDLIYGPGIYDMKAGSFLAIETLRRLARSDCVPPRPVMVLLNSDEEVGSPTSRKLIEEHAAKAAFVLVPEPGIGPGNAVVTRRKGWGRFVVKAYGRSAHAGGNLSEGRSAIREICRQVLDIEALNDAVHGVSFNVGTVRGGTRGNVVPAEAEIEVDMRMRDAQSGEHMVKHLLGLRSHDPDVRLEVVGNINRPPFERSNLVVKFYQSARKLAESLGLDLPETERGGVSDGNFAAALQRPVLDGLGCGGDGAHAEDEHILVSTIAPRAALLHAMLVSSRFQDEALQHSC